MLVLNFICWPCDYFLLYNKYKRCHSIGRSEGLVYIARDREGRGVWGGRVDGAGPLSPRVVIVGLCYPSIPQAPTVTTATLPQMYCKETRSEGGKSKYKGKLKEVSLRGFISIFGDSYHEIIIYRQYKVMQGNGG